MVLQPISCGTGLHSARRSTTARRCAAHRCCDTHRKESPSSDIQFNNQQALGRGGGPASCAAASVTSTRSGQMRQRVCMPQAPYSVSNCGGRMEASSDVPARHRPGGLGEAQLAATHSSAGGTRRWHYHTQSGSH